jgi:hypothetical protein
MPSRLAVGLRRPHPGPALRFGVDTFAFRNDSRIHHRGKPDLYASWCFVLARAVVQFRRFAHFEPRAPRLAGAEYTALVRASRAAPPGARRYQWPSGLFFLGLSRCMSSRGRQRPR